MQSYADIDSKENVSCVVFMRLNLLYKKNPMKKINIRLWKKFMCDLRKLYKLSKF